VDIRPIYEIDPPEMPLAWHADPIRSNLLPYAGPWGSKVILPRCLPLACREFTVPTKYSSKVSAHRHVAFEAYVGLYKAGLLNENLLPLTSVIEPPDEDVQAMLKDVERRAGMTNIGLQMDPWVGLETEGDEIIYWNTARICIGDLPPLTLFTRSEPVELEMSDGLKLFHPGADEPIPIIVVPLGKVSASDEVIYEARQYTRRLFSSLNWSRMDWDNLDFSYLFYPESRTDDDDVWEKRRTWLAESMKNVEMKDRFRVFTSEARVFGEVYGYNQDPVLVLKEFGRPYRFVDWRYEKLTEEEEEEMKKKYRRRDGTTLEIRYPLLVVKPFHPRCNFLVPTKPRDPNAPPPEIKYSYLMPELSGIALISSTEVEYAFLLPSVLRSLESTLTMASLRSNIFMPCPALQDIPLALLSNAMTASSAGEKYNYQRLETLGDTVLKYLVALQVLVEYPLWHEGYLTKKKDHTVANVNLAKENLKRRLYRWLIRGRFLYIFTAPLLTRRPFRCYDRKEMEAKILYGDLAACFRHGRTGCRRTANGCRR
jgi:endoribonuclease Dicer